MSAYLAPMLTLKICCVHDSMPAFVFPAALFGHFAVSAMLTLAKCRNSSIHGDQGCISRYKTCRVPSLDNTGAARYLIYQDVCSEDALAL